MMNISTIILIEFEVFCVWFVMLTLKNTEKIKTDIYKRRLKFCEILDKDIEKVYNRLCDDYVELKTKYDNVERELIARNNQYADLLKKVENDRK